VRFLSCEPLLGPVNLGFVENDGYKLNCLTGEQKDMGRPCESLNQKVDWVIVGGESGKQARRCNTEWIRSIVSQCKAASVPCFVKQLGGNLSDSDLSECGRATGKSMAHPKGGDPSEWPEDLRVREFPQP
jgi:protein gp37